jgi:outer membrane protein assembly factor BamA
MAGRRIRSVAVIGNEHTKPEIILREMKTAPGDAYSPAAADGDRKRIQGLGLFNLVEVIPEPEDGGVRLIVWVTERWALIPYPVFFLNDHDWKKLSYGAGVRHINVRGRAERLDLLASGGYNPAVRMAYENPWIGEERRLLAGVSLYGQRVSSRHFAASGGHEDHAGGRIFIGRRYGLFEWTAVSIGFRRVAFPKDPAGAAMPGPDRIPMLGASFTSDRRDLKEYASRGTFLSISVLKNGFPGGAPDYGRADADARIYLPIGPFTLACRGASSLSSGVVPVHDRVYLGYEERVRGHFTQIREGENRMMTAVALRFPILAVRHFDLDDDPGMRGLKFGLSAGFFIDAGTVWCRGEKPGLRRFDSGFGAGLHFRLPYVDVLRVEAAFDERGRSEWIIDLYADI